MKPLAPLLAFASSAVGLPPGAGAATVAAPSGPAAGSAAPGLAGAASAPAGSAACCGAALLLLTVSEASSLRPFTLDTHAPTARHRGPQG